MTKLMISTESSGKLFVGENRKSIHSNLLNLGFEESGHTGFQKELTEEQIAAIEAVLGKEDKANKTTVIAVASTDEQYPTAKAVKEYVAGELEGKEDKIVSPASYFKYTVADNTVTITGLTVEGKAATEINIPPIINDLPVTKLAGDVFKDDTNLISASLPVAVTEVGIRLFSGCTNLKTVKLPSGLTNISKYMFSRCGNLIEVNIPDSVTNIAYGAFMSCFKLKSVLVVPEGVETLEEGCFNGCTSVTKVVLPKSLKTIGNNVFGGNYSLININLPEGLTSMGDVVFYDCFDLKELYIPDSVTSIGSGDYFGTTDGGLSDITILCNPGSYAEAWAIENGIPYKHTELGSKISLKEDKANKTTIISVGSTDEQYPTAKATYITTHHIEEMVVAVAQGTADAISRTNKLTTDVDALKTQKADKTYVDSSIQSAILESWEVLV